MTTSMPLALTPPRAELVLLGEFDAVEAAALRCRLADAIAAGCVHFTIDASGVTFIDARGLGSLVRLRNALHRRGGSVEVYAASPTFCHITDVAGLTRVFGLRPVGAGTEPVDPHEMSAP